MHRQRRKKLIAVLIMLLHLFGGTLVTSPTGFAQTGELIPLILELAPNNGPVIGGTEVIIWGSNFTYSTITQEAVSWKIEDGGDAPVAVLFNGNPQDILAADNNKIVLKTTHAVDDVLVQDVVVENLVDDVPKRAEIPAAFTYTYEGIINPLIDSVSPAGGGAAGQTTVTITGQDFFTSYDPETDEVIYPDVYFADQKAEIIAVNLTEITIKSPPYWTGGYADVKVVNPGQGEALLNNAFFYKTQSATIDSITPGSGPYGGNPIWVRITGNHLPFWWEEEQEPSWNLQQGWEVIDVEVEALIGGVPVSNLIIQNESDLLAQAPTEGPRNTPLDVVLLVTTTIWDEDREVTLYLVEESTITGGFILNEFWDGPRVLRVENPHPGLDGENIGPLAGGIIVHVVGSNFSDNMEIYFGAEPAELVGGITTNPDNTNTQRVRLPAAEAPGLVTLRVVRPADGAEGFLPRAFVYRDTNMTLAQLFPSKGPALGGQEVTITGVNLDYVETVYFGTAVGEIIEQGRQYLLVKTPPYQVTTEPVDVTVVDPFGEAVLPGAYTFELGDFELALTALTPNWGTRTGGDIVYIESRNLMHDPQVFFGDTKVTNVEFMRKDNVHPWEMEGLEWQDDLADYVIRVVVPPGTTGWEKVRVQNLLGEEEELQFYYQSVPAIAAVEPEIASVKGGNIITVTGEDFVTDKDPELPIPGAEFSLTLGDIEITEWELTGAGLAFRIPVADGGDYGEGQYPLNITNADGGSVEYPDAIELTWASSQPAITDFSPQRGTFQGGTLITIHGSNFDQPRFYIGLAEGKINEADFLRIRGETPPFSGERQTDDYPLPVTVVNADGSTAIASVPFNYVFPDPGLQVRITSVFPDLVVAYNENPVTIQGAGFQPGLDIYVGDTKVEPDKIVIRDLDGNHISEPGDPLGTSIEFVTPRLAEGTYNITVVNPDTTLARKEKALTFRLRETRPLITHIIPAIGPLGGNTRVIIRGEDFREGLQVYFGDTLARDVVFIDEETAIAWTPPSTPGKKDVRVINPDGAGYVLENGFEYLDFQDSIPRITGIVPAEGPVTGGTTIKISGQDFYFSEEERVRVFIGYNEAVAEFEVRNIDEQGYGTEILVATPPGEPGTHDVFVFNPDGASFLFEGAFTYKDIQLVPKITTVEPAVGPLEGNIPISIRGENFHAGLQVFFGEQEAPDVVVENESWATLWLPSAREAGKVDVIVQNPDGGSSILPEGFEYIIPAGAPEIAAVTPTWGRTQGNTPVTISGSGFEPGAVVFFGRNPAFGITVQNTDTITATSPAGAEGTVDVLVVNPDGSVGVLPAGFTYLARGGPVIDNINPPQGHTAGGDEVMITGENFDEGISVYFAQEVAQVIEATSAMVRVILPPHAPGFVDVKVVNPDQTQATAAEAFEYVGPPLAPADVDVFLIEDTVIGLSWTETSGATGYEVYGRTANGKEMEFMGGTPGNYIYLTGLRPNTRYYFEIRALNQHGESDFSIMTVSARTRRTRSTSYYPPRDIIQITDNTATILVREADFSRDSSYLFDVSTDEFRGVNKYVVHVPETKLGSGGKVILRTSKLQLTIPLYALGVSSSRRSNVYRVLELEEIWGPTGEILAGLLPHGRTLSPLYKLDAYTQTGKNKTSLPVLRQSVQFTLQDQGITGEPAFYHYDPAKDRWEIRQSYFSRAIDTVIAQTRQLGTYVFANH